MNEKKIQALAEQANLGPCCESQAVAIKKFAELIVAEAFRAGMLYSAKKYADEGSERFTGNDVAMFLEMEACELTDEDIKKHFGVKE